LERGKNEHSVSSEAQPKFRDDSHYADYTGNSLLGIICNIENQETNFPKCKYGRQQLTAGTTTLAHLVITMLSLDKQQQLCSPHPVWHDKNLSFHSAKRHGVVPADVIRHHGSINKKISLNSRRIKT